MPRTGHRALARGMIFDNSAKNFGQKRGSSLRKAMRANGMASALRVTMLPKGACLEKFRKGPPPGIGQANRLTLSRESPFLRQALETRSPEIPGVRACS